MLTSNDAPATPGPSPGGRGQPDQAGPPGRRSAPPWIASVDAPAPAPRPPRAGRPEASVGRPLNVLLAEDNVVNQKVVTRMLEQRGHAVAVVGDGRPALEALDASRFDVVLMDIQMPEMDGFEARRGDPPGREARGVRRVPVIALTAHAMKGDRERCLAAGFDDYLSKPIHVRDLCAVIASALSTPSPTECAPPAGRPARPGGVRPRGGPPRDGRG